MTTAVRLPEDLEKRLDTLVEKTHRTKSYYIRRALEDFLEDREDYLLAASRWEEFVKSGKKGISLEEVKKRLGMNDDK